MSLIVINTLVNIIGANSLIWGFLYLRHHKMSSEQWCMKFSYLSLMLFLTSLLICVYEINVPNVAYIQIPYVLFSAVLTIHIILACFLPILIIFAIWSVVAGRFKRFRHSLVVHWIFPVWIMATFTGVFLYYFTEG